MRLTHGLVLAADGGGMVQDEDVTLKLPAGLGVQCRGNQDHPLANLVPLVLHREGTADSTWGGRGQAMNAVGPVYKGHCMQPTVYSSQPPLGLLMLQRVPLQRRPLAYGRFIQALL